MFGKNSNKVAEYKGWKNWANTAKAYANKYDGSSFAQVVKDSSPWSDQSKPKHVGVVRNLQKYSKKYATKNTRHSQTISKEVKLSGSHDKALSSPPDKQKYNQQSLSLANRFHILLCEDIESDSSPMVQNGDPPCATSISEVLFMRHITCGKQSQHAPNRHSRLDGSRDNVKNDQHHKLVPDISSMSSGKCHRMSRFESRY